MKADSWLQLKSLFHAAMDEPSDQRQRFLNEACAGDLDLQARVENLISSHEEAGPFLNNPAVIDAGVVPEAVTAEPAVESEGRIGLPIGPYEIIREIGQGGMGTVFLAVRADDQYRKLVAIKLVNRGMNTDAILRRFMMERQILANLEHPNIARLLEGGSTGDGLPYFVMEYVDGQPIDEYCDAQRFTTTQRLHLFREVCSALQYAHQNLVIHRDIKPGNILVTPEGVPKLLDFGIAKLLSPNWAGESREVTLTMQRLMTPAYASPEQLRGLRITTATDVYSLGVVLYELLSGHHPHKLHHSNADEVAEAVLSDEPVRPSIAVRHTAKPQSAEGTEADIDNTPEFIGKLRDSTVERLRRRLSGDLDNIVLKALRKEPSRRYASVQEFAEDIRRHMSGLPVNASPATWSYRLAKFAQRNKAVVTAAAVVALTLCLATGITAWEAHVARRERDKAQARFNQVRKLANKVLFEYNDGVEKLDGSIAVRQKMVKDASEYLDVLMREAASEPGLQNELAKAYQKLGDIQGAPGQANIGDRAGAIKSYGNALALSKSLLTKNPDKALLLDIAGLDGKLYQTLWRMGQQSDAEQHLHESLTVREQLLATEPGNLNYRLAVARSYRDFGSLLSSKTNQDSKGATDYYRRSNELCESIITSDAGNLEARAIAGLGYRMWGGEIEATDTPQALGYYQKALLLTQEREKLDPNNPQIQVVLADCYSNIGRAQMILRNDAGALENFNRALTVFAGRFAKDPTNSLLLMNLAQTYNNLGNVMAQGGRFPEALANYRQALNLRENYLSSHPGESSFRPRLGETSFDLGDLYAQMASDARTPAAKKAGFWREAKSWYQRSLDVWMALSQEGTLPGYLKDKPAETTKSLARCDAALANTPAR